MENKLINNLKSLRKEKHFSQEELAEKIGVSRQAIAKWERGESVPDIENCIALADLFDVTVDTLVRSFAEEDKKTVITPKGKHVFGMVQVNDKGQITIPKQCRQVFDIKPGEMLLILGDEEQGIALVKSGEFFDCFRDAITSGKIRTSKEDDTV